MRNPLSTGQAARELETIEPSLNDLVRRGKIQPPPPLIAGRRLWSREHLFQAAEHLGLLTPEMRERLTRDEVVP